MIKKFRLLSVLLSMVMLVLVGCSNNNSTSNSNSTTDKTNSNTEVTTTQDYYNYLTERYNYYLGNSKLFNDYDIYEEDFVYNGTNEDFIVEYDKSYEELKVNLESFKKDLENYVKKGTPEVDKLNAEVIADIDKAIVEVDKYTATLGEKTKDYATLAKDEMIKGFRDIGKASHDALDDLKDLVDNAKERLGIS